MSSSWVAIDFETANEHRGSPCAVGMTKVVGGHVADTWGTLIRPPAGLDHFNPFNVALHGIAPADVTGAPGWTTVLADIAAFADGLPLVAHNAGFDMSVIRSASDAEGIKWPELRYTCSQVVARRTWKLLTYSLPFCADAAGIAFTDHHDASADATAAAEVMLAAMRAAEMTSLDDLLNGHQIRWGWMAPTGEWLGSQYRGHGTGAREPLPGANPDADPDGALYGATVCLTGKLTSMTRDEAFHKLAEVGAQPAENVTKKTTILISASQTQLKPGDTLSGKAKKAQSLLDAGQDIEVLDEDEFLRRLLS
ncbi:exonuclease domain-containing protein [Streptomyces sp. NPDC051561]|uniref:exonuclease domain-containing protein n=1 Tax=Streptomyces sp. NPDC051561 TaxID=3365658 RepID=UPI0037A61F08